MAHQFQVGESIKPIRTTYKYMSGLKVKRPTTYDEATYNLEPKENFHYRPLWNSDMNIFDERITKVKCEDWEQFRDPARLYYATYCYSRADFQARIKGQFETADRYGLFKNMDPAMVDTIREFFPVLRHFIFGESVAFMYIGRASVGTAVEQCATYQCYDQMGTAQLITRICLELEDQCPTILQDGKQKWIEDEKYQKLRALLENVMVTWDWAEAMVAINLILDSILYPLFFEKMTAVAVKNGDSVYISFSQFFMEMFEYERNYTTALVKMLLEDRSENKDVIASYVNKWLPRVIEAVQPVLAVFDLPQNGGNGEEALQHVLDQYVKSLIVDELQLITALPLETTGEVI
jgi:phenol hydroxylase P1 protein